MNENYAYLKDLPFLKSLIAQPIQSIFVRFTSLDWNENPLCEIQGLATSGSMNLNGQSSIRRTCNLTITTSTIMAEILNEKIKQIYGESKFYLTHRHKEVLENATLQATNKHFIYQILERTYKEANIYLNRKYSKYLEYKQYYETHFKKS